MMTYQTPLAALFERHQGLVQTAIAAEALISQSHLSLLIAGSRQPSIAVGKRLIPVLRKHTGEDVTFEQLFVADDQPATGTEG